MLWVVVAIVVGLLIVLLVGVAIRPDDGQQSGLTPPAVGTKYAQV